MGGKYPCIPDIIALPSYKFSTRIRSTMLIGTVGDGWAAVRPFVPVNDQINGQMTTNLYAVGGYNPAAPVGVQNLTNDSPFTTADVKGMEFRVVGCGIKCTFSGSEFQRGGSIVLHRAPTNENITVPSTAADLLRIRTTTQAPAKRAYETVCYRPSDQTQLSYIPFDPLIAPAINQTLLILVTGATPGQSWYLEIITFWESIGNRQNPTPSHSDPNGMAAINSALAQSGVSNDTPENQLAATENAAKSELLQQSSILNSVADATTTLASKAAGFIGGPMAEKVVDLGITGLRTLVDTFVPPMKIEASEGHRGQRLMIKESPQSVRIEEID